MKSFRMLSVIVLVCLSTISALAQSGQGIPEASVTSKSVKAIGYQVGGGETTVDMIGSSLVPGARGEAKIEAKTGVTKIEVKAKALPPAGKLGTEFLTYVVWVVSPDGRTINVGEMQADKNGEGKLQATTQMQTFSLFITAEPYFAVRQPSELLVLENEMRKKTKGRIFIVSDYKLLKRQVYSKMDNPLALSLDLKNIPLEVYEARNSVEIAKSNKADQFAPEIYSKAEASLKMTENALISKSGKTQIVSTARQAVQFSEDARALSVQRQEAARIAAEREAAAAQAKAQAEAKAAAEAAEAKRRADLEAQRQAELAAAKQAQLKAEAAAEAAEAKRRADLEAQRQAELAAAKQAQLRAEAAAKEAQLKAEAEAAALKARMEADALKAREAAAAAEADRAKRAAEALRAQLLEQFNRILETRDTERGLVVNMADVLFDVGKYNLQTTAREKLARLSGILLAYPTLRVAVEGHTDSTGSDELNQKLSEQRAEEVLRFMLEQGLPETNLTAQGFGKTMPVADNATAAGRKQNRRVEIIISGEVIGSSIGQ